MRSTTLLKTTLMLWCILATLLLLTDVGAKTAKRDAIEQQLSRVRTISKEANFDLSGNRDFHDWLMMTSQQKMPQRLEMFYGNLNKRNMRRRLFYIYKWQNGRRESNRSDYALWLSDLADWFEEHAKSEVAQTRLAERKERAQKRLSQLRRAPTTGKSSSSDENKGKASNGTSASGTRNGDKTNENGKE